MKDRKQSANNNPDEAETITNVALFPPESDDSEANMRHLEVALPASNATYSLGRLENDLKTLQSKWRTVEKEMTKRDDRIVALQEEIDATRTENGALRQLKSELERDLDERRSSTLSAGVRLAEIESQNVELRVHLQELQDYIDGRKADWEGLNSQLREYEDTIQGINSELVAHESVVAGKEAEKAALASKVMELERELAELHGRRTERESSHAELQQSLSDQSRELGNLNGEAIRLHKDIESLQAQLAERDATVQSLQKEVEQNKSSSSVANEILETHADELRAVQEKLWAAEERARAYEASEAQLRDELAATKVELEEVGVRAAEHEIKAVELQAVLLEAQSDQKSLEAELDAQRELVDVLEVEVTNKQQQLDVLDRNADRLSAIESGIREIDCQIDDEWNEQPAELFEDAEGIFDPVADDVMLMPEELFPEPEDLAQHVIVAADDDRIRYALTGAEMVIGRSHKADIRLNSKYISREHARITVDETGVVIEDAGSMNGFLVNSERAMRHRLAHGDKLEIGKSKFQYLDMSMA